MLARVWPHLTFFELKITANIEIKWVGTGKELVAMRTELFIVVGVFPVELSAYQISIVCAADH